MKITKRGITEFKSKKDSLYYGILKETLRKCFNVNVSELPVILTTLGIQLPVKVDEYSYDYSTHDVKMKVERGETVIFHAGNMISPYPYIIYNGEEWILISKDRKVETLTKVKND